MLGLKVTTEDTTKAVAVAAEKAAFRNFGHAGASMSKDMKASLVTAEGPSEPGTPPHTHRGAYLRRAVRYAASKEGVVVGPMFSIVGESGAAHEHGEEFHGTQYPERPFAEPTLERALPRIGGDWQGSIGA